MPDRPLVWQLWELKNEAQFILYGLLFLYCLVRKAAAPERILSGVLFAMLAVDKVHHFLLGDGSVYWRQVDVGHMVIDAMVLPCVYVVALRANRVYPLWIAGAQMIAMTGHVYRLALTDIHVFAYRIMAIMPSYIQLVTIVLGVAFHMSRHRKRGSYPSWRPFSSRTPAPAAGPLRAA